MLAKSEYDPDKVGKNRDKNKVIIFSGTFFSGAQAFLSQGFLLSGKKE
jgi:hypothetical protein